MNEISSKQKKMLLAAGIDPTAFVSPAAKPAKKAKKAPKKVREAKKACYDKRIVRFESTKLGGVTKVDNRLLAAELRAALGREFTAKEWKQAKVQFKADLTAAGTR